MAKKEALSQFQSRLADRLIATDQQQIDTTANWLAVEISGMGFVLPLSQSGEIFPWAEPQPIPHSKDWFLGVTNLRGALYGVVNLTGFLNLQHESSTKGVKSVIQDKRLIGFHPAYDLNTVVVVDRLIGLKSQNHIQPTGIDHQYKDDHGQIWREIDLEQLSHDPIFMNIAQE